MRIWRRRHRERQPEIAKWKIPFIRQWQQQPQIFAHAALFVTAQMAFGFIAVGPAHLFAQLFYLKAGVLAPLPSSVLFMTLSKNAP